MTNSVARHICLQHARLVEVTSNIWGTKFKFHGLADSVPANLGQVTYRTSLLHLQPRQMTLVMTELRDDVPAGIFPRSRTKKEKMQPLQFEARAQKGNFPANLVPRIAQRRRENKISFEDKLHYGQTQVVTVAGRVSKSWSTSKLNRFACSSGPDPTFNPNLFSEDEEESFQEFQAASRTTSEAQPPPIAPMTPRNARLNSNRPKSQISNQFMPAEPLPATLSRVENFENELAYVDLQEFENLRTADGLRTGNTYRTPPRHNPPRCCDVPALQSPKNAVAPTQTIIATSNTGADYSNNIQRMKTALADQPGLVSKKEHENNKFNQISQDDKPVLTSCPSAIIPMHNGQASSTEASSSHGCSQGSIVNGLSGGPQSQIFLNGLHGMACSSNGIQGKNNHNNSSIGQPSSNNGPFGKNGIHLSSNHSPACSYQFPENIDQCIGQTCAYCTTKLKDPKSHELCGKTNAGQSTSSVTTANRVDEMRFIDEESRGEAESFDQSRGVHRTQTVVSIGPLCVNDSIVRSCSVGYLDMVDAQLVPCDIALKMLRKEAPNKRLVLVSRKTKRRKKNKTQQEIGQQTSKSPRLRNCGKSKSLDSSDIFPANEQIALPPKLPEHAEEATGTVNLETVEDKSNESLEKSPDAIEILDESAKLITGSVVVMSAEVKPNRLKSCNSPVR